MPFFPATRCCRLPLLAGVLLPVLLLAGELSAAAASVDPAREDPLRLGHLAEQWMAAQHPWQGQGFDVSLRAQPLDPRLRLPACRQTVTVALPPGQTFGSRTTLSLHCPDQPGWKLLLPVTSEVRAEVMVARQALAPGTVLSETVMNRQWRDISGLPQGYLAPEAMIGLQTRMTVAAGAILSSALVKPVPLVRKGQIVMLQAGLGSIAISMAGEALSDGGRGERVRVRNRQSGRVLEGDVTGDGQVRVLP